MTHDPKKPFDAPPGQTPELLQKDLSLDRRARRAPSFEELRAQPGSAANAPPAARTAEAPPVPARPRPATSSAQPPRPDVPRTAPPSPTEWAQAAPPRPATGPSGQPAAPVRPQAPAAPTARAPLAPPRPPAAATAEAAPRPSALPADLLVTQPGAPAAAATRRPPPMVSAPQVLPADLLTTQPGLPNPMSTRRAPEAPPRARPAEAPAPSEDLPSEASPRPHDDDVLAAPASLWRRLAAWLVDAALLSGVVLGLLVAAAQVIAGGPAVQKLAVVLVPGVLLAGLLAFAYASLFAFLWGGRSPGRRILGLHLVDDTGHAPSPVRALCRGVLSLVSFGLFLSGFWIALFDRRGQTLHDKLCSTFVVQLRDA